MEYSNAGSLNSCIKLNNISKIPLMPNLDFRNRIGTPCAHIERLATVVYTFTAQQTEGEMNEGLFWFVLIFVGIQLIELRFHCWIVSCQFLD